jgi:hypothetical protein
MRKARIDHDRKTNADPPLHRYVSPAADTPLRRPADTFPPALATSHHLRKNWDASWKASVSKAPPF